MISVGQLLDQALADKDWGKALEHLRAWTAERPDDFNGWYWTAYCLIKIGKPQQARIAAQKACSLKPSDRRALLLLERTKGPQASASTTTTVEDDVPVTEVGPDALPPATETGRAGRSPSKYSTTSTLWKTGDVINGRYEVREVRRGGMGEVYFVFDRALALDLAVKTPLPKTLATPSGRLRFLREAEAWIGLGLHANICAAYYVQELGGVARLFIELIDGDGLDQWMTSEKARGVSQRIDIAIQVASGMQHAHTFEWVDEAGDQHQGLAHRDLKPANVLIGSDGVARVTDFGLVGRGFAVDENISTEDSVLRSTAASPEGIWKTVTLGGGLMGTPPYMPPEQWDGGHAAGKPADIYAFGCILFELFCGRRPFLLTEQERLARVEVQLDLLEKKHRTENPPLPRSLNRQIDEDLSNLMMQCLEKEPARRPQSFAEIRQRLVAIFAHVTSRTYPRVNPTARQLLGDALNNQGMSYATLGHGRRAENAWKGALLKDPHHIEATFNLTLFQWQFRGVGNSETLARMEEVLKGDNPPWKAHHLAGKLHLAVGEWPRAVELLRSAHSISTGMPEVARDYALALCSHRESSTREAHLKEAVDILARYGGPLRSDPIVLTTYAFATRELGQEDKSAGLYKHARTVDPHLPEDLSQGCRQLIPGLNCVRRLEGFSGRVVKISIEATGQRAATVLHSGAICIWDTVNGQIERMLRPPGERSRCLALSPDGTAVLATAEGDPVTIWNADKGTIRHRLQAHPGFINALRVTNDGRRVVGVGTTGVVNVWDFESRLLVQSYPVHSGYLTSLSVSADCSTAVIGGSGGKVLVVGINDGEIITRPQRHQAEVTAVSISQGGRIAVSGDESGELRVWTLPEGGMTHVLKGHQGAIRCLSIDEASSHCLSLDSTGSLRLWVLSSGQLLASLSVPGEGRGAAFSPDWRTVLVGHGATGLSQFDFGTLPDPPLTWAVASPVTVGEAAKRARNFAAHLEGARSFLAAGDAVSALAEIDLARSIPGYGRMEEALDLAAIAGRSFTRDGIKGAWSEGVYTLHTSKVNCARVNPADNSVLTVGADRRVLISELSSGTILRSLEPVETPDLSAVFLSASGQCATAGLDNVVRLWDFKDKTTVRIFSGHQAQINDLASAGSLILSGSSDGTARVWDTQTGVCLQVFDGHSREILAVAFSPDARMCASSGEDELLLWDPLSGRDLMALAGHSQAPTAIVWSDDGRHLVSGGRDGQLRLWDIATGNCLRTIDVNKGIVSLAMSPDDRFAVIGSVDGSVELWDVRSRRCLRTFTGHVGPVSSVAFSIDGQRTLSAGEDGTTRLWYLDWHTDSDSESGSGEQTKPYLEVFLSRQSQGSTGPKWKDKDFQHLLEDLERRRLGRVNPEEIRRTLDRMAGEWKDPSATNTIFDRRTRHHRIASSTRKKTARKRLLWRAVVIATVLPVLLIVWSTISSGRLRIDSDRQNAVQETVIAARFPFSVPGSPAADCDRGNFRNYLETFVDDSVFDTPAVDLAGRCLAQLRDPRAVEPLFRLLRPSIPVDFEPEDPETYDDYLYFLPAPAADVLSILVAVADEGYAELQEGLVDEAAGVRYVAARALAANGGERAIGALMTSAEDREPVVRIAVSQTLETIAASGAIPPDEAFTLFELMAGDTFPEVRTNVAASLGVFRGSRPKRLLEELADDRDPDVRQAAEKTLQSF